MAELVNIFDEPVGAVPPERVLQPQNKNVLVNVFDEPAPQQPVMAEPHANEDDAALRATNWLGGQLGDIYSGARDLVTGDTTREFDYGELPSEILGRTHERPGGKMEVLGARMPLAQSMAGKVDIFRSLYPDVAMNIDKFGNPIAAFDEGLAQKYGTKPGSYYLNRPGLSWSDLDDAGMMALFALPQARMWSTLLGAAGPLFGRVVGSALGGLTGSLTQDVTAQTAGSKQSVDTGRSGENAAFMGATETLAPAVSALWRRVVSSPRFFDPAAGTLSDEGKRILIAAGIDPAQITDEFAKRFAQEAATAANPKAGAAFAEAQSLPVPVPLTKGAITRDPNDQMFESLADKGVFGEGAKTAIKGAGSKTDAALWGNVPAIQGKISGGALTVREAGQGGRSAAERLNAIYDDMKTQVDEAYNVARATNARMPNVLVPRMQAKLLPILDNFADDFADPVRNVLSKMDRFAPQAGEAVPEASLNKLEQIRHQLSSLTRSNEAGVRKAAGDVLDEFDAQIDRYAMADMLKGDPEALDAWKNARGLRREMAKRFEQKDILKKLTERKVGEPETTVSDMRDAANLIFGSANLNLNKKGLMRDLMRVRNELGADSQQWNSLREEAFLRLMHSAEGQTSTKVTERMFSGANLSSEFDSLMREAPDIMRVLFGKDLPVIQQLRNVAVRGMTKVPGGDNPSGTAIAQANIVKKVVDTMFRLPWFGERSAHAMGAILPVKWALDFVQGQRALSRAMGKPPAKMIPPGIIGPALGPAIEEGYGGNR